MSKNNSIIVRKSPTLLLTTLKSDVRADDPLWIKWA